MKLMGNDEVDKLKLNDDDDSSFLFSWWGKTNKVFRRASWLVQHVEVIY